VASRLVDVAFIAKTANRSIKKELEAIAVKLFEYLVAGIGFEPMTFGL
jgi:hypothetical protein